MARISPRVLAAFVAVASLRGDTKKLTMDQRIELVRGLMSEFATVKVMLPRSAKPLPFESTGAWDQKKWAEAARKNGPSARAGDMVKVTHVDVDDDAITLQINDGMKTKGSFWDRVQVDMGGATSSKPVKTASDSAPNNGTSIKIRFKDSIGDVTAVDVKKLLAPVLDFEKHSASEVYMDTLPPPIQKAIKDKKPIEGMDADQVLMAVGRPDNKDRYTKGDVDYEDWIYGAPPGKVTFVTFSDRKVVKVKEEYADINGSVAITPQIPQ
jgi:hypothetical protein